MDRTNEINSMLEHYGEYWILRDLDYFPEKISELCRCDDRYFSVWRQLQKQINENQWAAFKREIEAIEESERIRCSLGLEFSETLNDRKHKIYGEIHQQIDEFKKNLEEKYGKETVERVKIF